ncbi:PQQ-dependent sugar dehydrogenase [Akkermansiaceae bacterium]|nr:PQQ-dependent sugar dehydrogenase [Akkermansiaceae bacterium]
MNPIPAVFLAILTAAPAAPLIKQTLATGLLDPMEVAIAPDGNLFVAEREGRLLRINPQTGGIFEIGNITVEALRSSDPKSNYAREDGLLGIALDPDFTANQRIFLYYSAPDVVANRLSRFTLKDGKIDPASELKLLEIPTEREHKVCHHGGSVEFGPDGLLYVSTGDNTNPFESGGVAPIDDREGRTERDAQRSAGNTNDLRGKILRIKPTETGYEIPAGNLFKPGTEKTRPEIYVMGCRNPFRISIDPKTKTLYWGEVGPDAKGDSPKGPMGHDEVNQAKKAGNYGWPFVIADNKPYPIVDFNGNKVGKMTDPSAPENPGQRNTGLKDLPPAQAALIWYPYGDSQEFPVMGKGGRNAMAGPVFYHDPSRKTNILGKGDDRTLLTYDWIRGNIFKAKLAADERLEKLDMLMDKLVHPMDLEMDRDGSLILLEYGSGWYFNTNGSVSRLIPDDGNKPPTLAIKPTPGVSNGYSVDKAEDPENGKITVTWYATEGVTERELGSGSGMTLPEGVFSDIRAVATDDKGARAFARIALDHSKEMPQLALEIDSPKKPRGFGDEVKFKVSSKVTPDAKQIVFRARYIEPTGHDSGGPEFTADIAELAKSSQCLACHQVDGASVGPSYLDVSLRYSGRGDAAAYLAGKLKTGGGGVWGDVPMPPQVALKPEDSGKLIAAILGLSKGISEARGTLQGSIKLSPQGESQPGGAWEFSAEAPGFSAARIRVAAQ